MKAIELKENEHLKISNGYLLDKNEERAFPPHRYYMNVFTDGVVASEGKPLPACKSDVESIVKQYDCRINTLESKDLQLKDYTYAITYTIVQKWAQVGRVGGWFEFCVGMNVYMKNPKDRKTIRTVRKVLKDIEENNRSGDYSSVWAATFSKRRGLQSFEPKKIGDNIIQLAKK